MPMPTRTAPPEPLDYRNQAAPTPSAPADDVLFGIDGTDELFGAALARWAEYWTKQRQNKKAQPAVRERAKQMLAAIARAGDAVEGEHDRELLMAVGFHMGFRLGEALRIDSTRIGERQRSWLRERGRRGGQQKPSKTAELDAVVQKYFERWSQSDELQTRHQSAAGYITAATTFGRRQVDRSLGRLRKLRHQAKA